MSVICQNFVQNAWKKDLCSNCFKSLSDHDVPCHPDSHRSPVASPILPQTGYISQATTIYQSRGILNHATWTSLLTDRQQDKGGSIFKLENGFHGEHLKISPNRTNGISEIKRVNGVSNGHHKEGLQNGNCTTHTITSSILKASRSPSGKKRSVGRVNGKVGFTEEEALVIGYGGNDYDSDDNWEPSSPDDADFPLDILDATEEDRAISRITKENTEFNSKNDNLLQAGLVASCLRQQNKADDEREEKTKNINGFCRADVKEAAENSGKAAGLPNRLSARPQAARREAPPQASVKPMLRTEGHCKSDAVQNDIDKDNLPPDKEKQTNVEVVHESVIVLIDSAITSIPTTTTTTMNVSDERESGEARPRPSFLHGTPTRESSPPDGVSVGSAIYTPSKTELFCDGSRSSSEESSPQMPCLHRRQRSISETDLALYQASGDGPVPAAAAASSRRLSKPDHVVSDSNLSAGNEIVQCPARNAADKESALTGGEGSAALAKSPRKGPTSGEEPAVYYAVSNTIVHGEFQRPAPQEARIERQACHYAESSVYKEGSPESEAGSRSSPKNRETKLAALAQELEQARHGGGQKRQAPSPPKVAETSPPPSTVSTREEPRYGHPFLLEKPPTTSKSSSGKTKSATISSVQGKKVLALLTLEENAKTNKKGKFSIKKFLKRGKDLESIDTIFQNGSSPNPKAWKQNSDFDRSKLKLEIIHPMDMVGPKEVQSTNPAVTPDGHYASTSLPSPTSPPPPPADSPWSAGNDSPTNLRHSTSSSDCTQPIVNGIYDDDTTWQVFSHGSNGSPLPTSESSCGGGDVEVEGTPLLSTFSPSGSTGVYLPPADQQPPTPTSPEPVYGTQRLSNSCKPIRPPKPPPPPRIRPFSPNNYLRENQDQSPLALEGKPAVSNPKPQVPKRHFKPGTKSEYANLGDVRHPMAPQKPDRSPTTSSPGFKSLQDPGDTYEPIEVNHHKNTLNLQESVDETPYYEMYEDIYQEGSSLSHFEFPIKDAEEFPQQPLWRESDRVTLTVSNPGSGPPGPGRGEHSKTFCGDNSAWLSLEQSYAIVAAANHEVLAKLIGQVAQQKMSSLSKGDGQPLLWSDFCLQTSQPLRIVGRDKTVFNALFRHPSKREVTLVVTCPPSSLSYRESPSKHIFLATFLDNLPAVACAWDAERCAGDTSSQQALVHVLPKSEVTSVQSFFLENKERQRLPTFEKEFCFIFLQLIQALKILQAHGTEEVDLNMEQLVLFKREKSHVGTLVLFSSDFTDGKKVALCQYALKFMLTVLGIENTNHLSTNDCHPTLSPAARKIFITVANVLTQEKSSSLSKAKNFLEFHLWGPREYIYSLLHGTQGVEDTLQRWLDIERAQSLRLLVKSHKNISAYEEQQHQFLVQTSAKILKDLSSSLCFEKL